MKKHLNFLTIVLVVSLLVCSFSIISIPAAAETTTGTESALEIEYANVAYNAMTQLAFTLKGTVADGMEAGIAVWNPEITGEKTIANASYTSFKREALEGKTYWLTEGIAANAMSKRLTVAPVVRNEETKSDAKLAGPLIEYSIYDYVADRLDDEGVTDKQMKLYENLIIYGNSAEKVVNGAASMPIITAKNGYVGNIASTLGFVKDGKSLIRANAMNSDGDYFLYWTDKSGNKIYERVAEVAATEAINRYTAVYGNKADSAYAGHFDLSSLAVGQLNIVPSTIGTVSKAGDIYYVQNNATFLDGALTLYYGRIQVNSDTDKTVVKTTNLSVAEKNGAKHLHYEKNGVGGGQPIEFVNKSGIAAKRFEIDMAYTYRGGNENTALHFFFGSNDCRIDVRYEENGDIYFFKNGTSTKVYGGNFAIGERFTVSAEVNADGLVVVSVNGKALTSAKDGTHLLDGFDFGLTAATVYTASKLWHESYSYDTNITEIYNVNFVDTTKLQ